MPLLAEDRAAGLDLERRPADAGDAGRPRPPRSRVLWTFHHLLLDGWSLFQVLVRRHARRCDGDRTAGPTAVPGLPAAWLAEQDDFGGRGTTGGSSPACRAPRRCRTTGSRPAPRESTATLRIDCPGRRSAGTRAAQRLDRQHRRAGRVGAAAGPAQRAAGGVLRQHRLRPAGRSARRRDGITGIFISTLPSIVDVEESSGAGAVAAPDPGRAGGGPAVRLTLPRRPAPCSTASWCSRTTRCDADLGLRDLRGVETTNYPLAVVAYPGDRLTLAFGYDPELFDAVDDRRLWPTGCAC